MRFRLSTSWICASISVFFFFPSWFAASSFSPDKFPSPGVFFTLSNYAGCCKLDFSTEGEIGANIPGFSQIHELFPPGTLTRLMAADVDCDGDLDLLVNTRSSGLLIWYNDGCGHFTRNPLPQYCSGAFSGAFFEPTECSSSLCQEPASHFFVLPLSNEISSPARPLRFSNGFFFRGFSRPPPIS
jgi:hypothetical protein